VQTVTRTEQIHTLTIRGVVPKSWNLDDPEFIAWLHRGVADLTLNGFPGGGLLETRHDEGDFFLTAVISRQVGADLSDVSSALRPMQDLLARLGVDPQRQEHRVSSGIVHRVE
jgi:hypothetical protein